jgi:hypothetical protein
MIFCTFFEEVDALTAGVLGLLILFAALAYCNGLSSTFNIDIIKVHMH